MPTLAHLVADGCGLPFAAAATDLAEAVSARGTAVVEAPPGTGKTTLAPAIVVGCVEGRVVVTQPRRVAARAAARRLASLTGTRVGELVGFTVRGERATSPGMRIEIVTPGVLLRRLLADPALDGVGAVILDEVHERGLETDLLTGLLSEVRELREDLVLVAMSATLDAAGLATLIDGPDGAAPVVGCPAASYPLAVYWAPPTGPAMDARGVNRAFLQHVSEVAVRAFDERPDGGDLLVFLPGVREVSDVASRLRGRVPAEVLELHGRVNAREQDRAVSGRRPGEPARIVVSTALAESSLTVDGVRAVVDAGLAREPRRDAMRGMSGLVTVTCSRASADQRAGRAARQGPGVVWRCYDERAYAAMRPQVTPEAATADLTAALLTLACWGAPRGEGLRLPSALPAGAIRDAERVLRSLGAVDEEGRVTSVGRALAAVPADPRWARALVDGAALVGRRRAAEIVASVELDAGRGEPDLDRALSLLRKGSGPDGARWRTEIARLERAVPADRPHELSGTSHSTGTVIALAFPERVARRTGASYLLASGTRAAAPAALAGHEWLAVANVTRADGAAAAGTGAVIRAGAALDEATARQAASHLVSTETRGAIDQGRLTARRLTVLGAIELSSTPVPASEVGEEAVRDAVRSEGLAVIGWSDSADLLRRRLALLRRHFGDPWPDMAEEALLARLDEWLGPELTQAAVSGRLRSIDFTSPLGRLLPWPDAVRLDELVPERLVVPSGSAVRLDYPPPDEDGPVVCAVKLQECFGLAESPTILDGRVRVLFHLLSPARRPLAVTDDLASFWAGPYAQVRAEMRGRYPKHPWPEDPWSAPATARTNRR
ncbi:ATP-dependent helicase HrpB [Blastococcus sp. Marseille-P5729]|uniref:ATP-dependent helicase HrpB n=1 Tax=Blastococcus sp. Marseille-P5729 TaxID=2086582 RepID=UPI001F311593|nr:ATP-dependent helicase HrpB [Blastococcus sp. Marseille-P5729]